MEKLTARRMTSLTPAEAERLATHAQREQRPESWIIRRALLAYLNGGKAK